MIGGTLRTEILTEGVHSGSSSGVVPSSFRIARMLLSRVEEEATGKILLPELHQPPIPPARIEQVRCRKMGRAAVQKMVLSPAPWTSLHYTPPHAPDLPSLPRRTHCHLFQAAITAGILGDAVFKNFPFVAGAGPTTADLQVRVDRVFGEGAESQCPSLSPQAPLPSAPVPALPSTQELLLRRTWRPALSVTGAAGLPSLEQVEIL
jgi:hypothetical protein